MEDALHGPEDAGDHAGVLPEREDAGERAGALDITGVSSQHHLTCGGRPNLLGIRVWRIEMQVEPTPKRMNHGIQSGSV